MFASLLKGMLFLIVSGSLAFGTIYLTDLSGYITLNLNGSELTISILIALAVMAVLVLLLFLVIALFNFGVAVTRFLSGDETAISRFFYKSRQIKGNKALSKALISFQEGDSAEALIQSGRAKNLLKHSILKGFQGLGKKDL